MRATNTCLRCGVEFNTRTAHHVYCSCSCREGARRGRSTTDGNALEVRAWEGTAIQRRRADGYVNATAMCKAGGKRWPDYVRLDRTTAYIEALAPVVGICTTGNPGLIQTIQGGRPELQGTWIHPRLAVDLARWISPAFAVWMDGWFLEAAQGQSRQPASKPKPRPARRRRPLQADGPTQITWGDRVTLIGLAAHAREIDAAVTKILRSGVLSE